jgi:hypothetical protein
VIEHKLRTDRGAWRPKEAPTFVVRSANQFTVGHYAFEFARDFGQVLSDSTTLQLHTRIVISPA